MPIRRVTSRFLLFVLASCLLTGCIINASSRTRYEGVMPTRETLDQIQRGRTSVDWLIASAGEPASRQQVDERTELLRYERIATVDKSFSLFVLMHTKEEKQIRESVVFEAIDGIIDRYWTESAAPDASPQAN